MKELLTGTHFANERSYLSIQNPRHYSTCVSCAIQNRQFSKRIENPQRNSKTWDYHVIECLLNANNAFPLEKKKQNKLDWMGFWWRIFIPFYLRARCHASTKFWTSNPIWFDHFPEYLAMNPLDSIPLKYSNSVDRHKHHKTSPNARDEYLSSWKESINQKVLILFEFSKFITFFNSNICDRFKWIFFSLIRLMATLHPL